MSLSHWSPLFITANVSIEVINKVLYSAHFEVQTLNLGDDFYNHWVLIQNPLQTTFSKPTNAVSLDFDSGFSNHTLNQIKHFVDTRLGENGLGQGETPYDNLSDDRFGIIDERTAEDETILFVVYDMVDSLQEAEIRVAWNDASEHDRALVRCSWSEDTESDIEFLASTIGGIDDTMGIGEMSDKVYNYMDDLRNGEAVMRWFEIRLDVGYSVLAHGGIWLIGAADTLIDRTEFDEDGVMRGRDRIDQS
ncbi:unnamed protein product [Aureobasidium mustum]|uniref:Uncharacterized protein n=1 Tax=Aureobasidium mustum TaxID=2773714 RepID=A0A9N8K153_9PEZI|nr:unnamed protein product [Aureobasidium mustum]